MPKPTQLPTEPAKKPDAPHPDQTLPGDLPPDKPGRPDHPAHPDRPGRPDRPEKPETGEPETPTQLPA